MKIAIIGAGLLGRFLAWQLQQQGDDITVFDKSVSQENTACGFVAAGMLAPFAEIETIDSMNFNLALEGLKQWPGLLKTLDVPIFFKNQGSLLLSSRGDEHALQHFINLLQKNTTACHGLKKLNNATLTALEPELEKHQHGFYLPQEACLDNQHFLSHLGELLQASSVTWLMNHEVIVLHAGLVKTAIKTYHFDWVFDCRGLGAQPQLSTLRGVRGELLHLHAPEVRITRPTRLFHPRYRLYIVPKPNHHYVIGASEIEVNDDSPISVRTTLELLSAAYYVHPGFAEARIIKTVTQCRPAFPDQQARIYFSDGLTRINGLYRHGFLLAPSLVEQAILAMRQGLQAVTYPEIFQEESYDNCTIE